MSRSIKKRWTLFGVPIGAGATFALVIGLGVLAGAVRGSVGPAGLLNRLTKWLIERAMDAS